MGIRHGNTIICFAIMFVFLAFAPYTAAADTITVKVSGGDFPSLQQAVDQAKAGDTVLVSSGTYLENVIVNKELTIISESGNPDDTIIQANNSHDNVFHVTQDNVTISGLKITGANGIGKAGISLDRVGACAVNNNIISGNGIGLVLDEASNNTLSNNIVSNNELLGIALGESDNNRLKGNNASHNGLFGIVLKGSSNNTLSNNTVNSNDRGIFLVFSYNNELSNNTANSNDRGIHLEGAANNTVSRNTANSNDRGIHLEGAANNQVNDNILLNNEKGIYEENSSNNNSIFNNEIKDR